MVLLRVVHSPLGHSGADLAQIARGARGRARRAGTALSVEHLRKTVSAGDPPDGGEVIRPAPSVYTSRTIKAELTCLMGGRAAEKILLGNISSGSGGSIASDLDQATILAIARKQQRDPGQSGLVYTPWASLNETPSAQAGDT